MIECLRFFVLVNVVDYSLFFGFLRPNRTQFSKFNRPITAFKIAKKNRIQTGLFYVYKKKLIFFQPKTLQHSIMSTIFFHREQTEILNFIV